MCLLPCVFPTESYGPEKGCHGLYVAGREWLVRAAECLYIDVKLNDVCFVADEDAGVEGVGVEVGVVFRDKHVFGFLYLDLDVVDVFDLDLGGRESWWGERDEGGTAPME